MSKRKFNYILLPIFILFSFPTFSQTDSTDISLSTTPTVLSTAMDTILFGSGAYEDYLINFTINDTLNFGHFIVEFSLTNGQPLLKKKYTLSELQNATLIDSSWVVSLNFGRFETTLLYRVNLIICNYAGISSPVIIKQY